MQSGPVLTFTGTIASIAGFVLGLFLDNISVEGVAIGSSAFSIRIVNACNGIYVTALLVSAIIATPATWRRKLQGIIIGVVLVIVHFLVMLAALAFLYVDPVPGLEHYLHALGFSIPWLIMNGAFGGYTAYALSQDLSARE